jgi:hypothetical protein
MGDAERLLAASESAQIYRILRCLGSHMYMRMEKPEFGDVELNRMEERHRQEAQKEPGGYQQHALERGKSC